MEKRRIILFFPITEKANVNKNTPLALLKVGSQLKGAGYDVSVIDERFEANYETRLKDELRDALLFGASVMTGYQIHGALKASRLVKAAKKNLPVVWGGWHPSLLPTETLKEESIDIVVRGQGEITINELADAIKSKNAINDIEGIGYKKDGKVLLNKYRPFQDVNTFHQTVFDILKIERYISKTPLGERSIFWNSSQGCPFKCGFCCTPAVYGRRWTGLRAERLFDEVKRLVEDYRVDSVTFAEDNFFVDTKRIEALCRLLLESDINIRWATDVRIDKINKLSEEFMRLLKDSGCVKLAIGAESGDEDILNLIDKKIHLEDTYRTAEKLQRFNIVADFFVVVGFPGNPEKDLRKSLKMINEIKSAYSNHQFTPLIFTPYPGIPLLELSIKHGLKIPKHLEGWKRWSVLSVNTPWIDEKYLDSVNMYTKYLYPVAFPSASLNKIMQKRVHGLPYRMLHKIAQFRVKNNFFAFPIEWILLKIFYMLKVKFKLFEGVDTFR